ncbi:hypothetical protein BDM02DRAFT_3194012 [Thelephora ganbajun]|uniref:Uncharacterized protein n=1 Tax=Thelephora ganbajun TaxID=370292 RepID=A0ACB6YX89_THEGA|nr:hypothetical protein BDM02DRAFT_3194012 [Thelephora ganbajun]
MDPRATSPSPLMHRTEPPPRDIPNPPEYQIESNAHCRRENCSPSCQCPICGRWIGLGPKGGEWPFRLHVGSISCARERRKREPEAAHPVPESAGYVEIPTLPSSPFTTPTSSASTLVPSASHLLANPLPHRPFRYGAAKYNPLSHIRAVHSDLISQGLDKVLQLDIQITHWEEERMELTPESIEEFRAAEHSLLLGSTELFLLKSQVEVEPSPPKKSKKRGQHALDAPHISATPAKKKKGKSDNTGISISRKEENRSGGP